MALVYGSRKSLGRNVWLNFSQRDSNGPERMGRRVTFNSRGGGRIRIAKQLSWRFGNR